MKSDKKSKGTCCESTSSAKDCGTSKTKDSAKDCGSTRTKNCAGKKR